MLSEMELMLLKRLEEQHKELVELEQQLSMTLVPISFPSGLLSGLQPVPVFKRQDKLMARGGGVMYVLNTIADHFDEFSHWNLKGLVRCWRQDGHETEANEPSNIISGHEQTESA